MLWKQGQSLAWFGANPNPKQHCRICEGSNVKSELLAVGNFYEVPVVHT